MNDLLSEQTITDVAKRLGYSLYKYPRPGLCADVIAYYTCQQTAKQYVLLIKRGGDPFKGSWALPGGFVNEGETMKLAARRELEEETGVKAEYLDFFVMADKPNRDPRGWTIAGVYAMYCIKIPEVNAADDAVEHAWYDTDALPELAFDHKDILDYFFNHKGYYFENE